MTTTATRTIRIIVDSSGAQSNVNNLNSHLNTTNNTVNNLQRTFNRTTNVVNNNITNINNNLQQTTQQANRAGNSLNKLSGFIAGFITVAGMIGATKSIAEIGDEYAKITGLLRNATDSQEQFNDALALSKKVATDTRAGLTGTVETFAALNRVTQGTGRSQVELFGILSTINKSIALTSPAAESAAAALTQFGQALGGDFKAGAQELNSILEQAPGLAEAVARGLGVATKDLKKMGEQGELSTEKVLNALQKISEDVDVRFSKIPKTVSGALTLVRNDLLATFGEADVAAPLISSIEEFGATLKDPAVSQGLVSLGAGIVKLVGWIAELASGFATLGKNIGYFFADVTGQLSEVDRLERKISDLDKALAGSTIYKLNEVFAFRSEAETKALRDQFAQKKQEIEDGWAGIDKAEREAINRRNNMLAGVTVPTPSDVKIAAPELSTQTPVLSFSDSDAEKERKKKEEQAKEDRARAAEHAADEIRGAKELTASLGLELETRTQVASFYRQAQLAEGQSIYEQERAMLQAQSLEKVALINQRATEDTERRNEQHRQALEEKNLNETEIAAIDAAYREQQKAAIAVYEQEKNAIEEAAAQKRIAIAKAEKEAKIQLGFDLASSGLAVLQAFGSQSEKSQKRMARVGIAVDTARGVAAGVRLGLPAGIPAIAWAIANGKKALNSLNSAGSGSIGGGAGGGASISDSSAVPTSASEPSVPQFQQKKVIEFISNQRFVDVDKIPELFNDDNMIITITNAQTDAQRRGVI